MADQEIEHFGEAALSDQLMHQVLPAHGDAGRIAGRDMGHVPGHGAPSRASLKSRSFVLYSLRCSDPYGTSWTSTVAISVSRMAAAMADASASSGAASAASSTCTGRGGSCRTALTLGLIRIAPLTF